MKQDSYFAPYTKVSSKQFNNLSLTPDAITSVERNIHWGNSKGHLQKLLGVDPRNKGNKSKNIQMGLPEAKKLMHCKGIFQYSEG